MDTSEFIRNNIDSWNKRDKDAFLADFDTNCEITGPGGMVLRGRDGAELFWHTYQDAFPNNHMTVHTLFGTADSGAVEAVFEGAHTGVLRGADGSHIPPTGRTTKTSYAVVYTFHKELIKTAHLYYDQFELFAQLGVGPRGA